MPMHDDKHVKITGCTIVWDGITRPDTGPDGKPKFSLKVVVPPQSQDLPLMNNLANLALQESKFQGVLPQGARMPIGTARQDEFNGMFPGWAVLNCNSNRLPDVYDANGQRLDPMQYGPQIYGGQQVDVLVHCYEYDKAGNRGIATGLDGFECIVAANAQRQNFGGAGIDTSGAFGGGGGGGQQQGGQPQQAHDFMPPGGGPSGPAAPSGPSGPSGPNGPAAGPKYRTSDGVWTRAQLIGAGYNDAQIDTLPVEQ